jgi:hypothetical protein
MVNRCSVNSSGLEGSYHQHLQTDSTGYSAACLTVPAKNLIVHFCPAPSLGMGGPLPPLHPCINLDLVTK